MENKIQELTDKIYSEGVEKGNEEAQRLISSARKEAAKIVEDARKEAESILAVARKSAKELSLIHIYYWSLLRRRWRFFCSLFFLR